MQNIPEICRYRELIVPLRSKTAKLGGASAIQANLIAFLRPYGSKRPEVERGLYEPCSVKKKKKEKK